MSDLETRTSTPSNEALFQAWSDGSSLQYSEPPPDLRVVVEEASALPTWLSDASLPEYASLSPDFVEELVSHSLPPPNEVDDDNDRRSVYPGLRPSALAQIHDAYLTFQGLKNRVWAPPHKDTWAFAVNGIISSVFKGSTFPTEGEKQSIHGTPFIADMHTPLVVPVANEDSITTIPIDLSILTYLPNFFSFAPNISPSLILETTAVYVPQRTQGKQEVSTPVPGVVPLSLTVVHLVASFRWSLRGAEPQAIYSMASALWQRRALGVMKDYVWGFSSCDGVVQSWAASWSDERVMSFHRLKTYNLSTPLGIFRFHTLLNLIRRASETTNAHISALSLGQILAAQQAYAPASWRPLTFNKHQGAESQFPIRSETFPHEPPQVVDRNGADSADFEKMKMKKGTKEEQGILDWADLIQGPGTRLGGVMPSEPGDEDESLFG